MATIKITGDGYKNTYAYITKMVSLHFSDAEDSDNATDSEVLSWHIGSPGHGDSGISLLSHTNTELEFDVDLDALGIENAYLNKVVLSDPQGKHIQSAVEGGPEGLSIALFSVETWSAVNYARVYPGITGDATMAETIDCDEGTLAAGITPYIYVTMSELSDTQTSRWLRVEGVKASDGTPKSFDVYIDTSVDENKASSSSLWDLVVQDVYAIDGNGGSKVGPSMDPSIAGQVVLPQDIEAGVDPATGDLLLNLSALSEPFTVEEIHVQDCDNAWGDTFSQPDESTGWVEHYDADLVGRSIHVYEVYSIHPYLGTVGSFWKIADPIPTVSRP